MSPNGLYASDFWLTRPFLPRSCSTLSLASMPDSAPSPHNSRSFQAYAAMAVAAYTALLSWLTLRAGVPWLAVAVSALTVAGVTASALRPDRQDESGGQGHA